jgi:hypothetical protein
MSPLDKLISALQRDGVGFWLEGGELRYRAAEGVMTAERLAELRVHREAIVSLLNTEADLVPLPPVAGSVRRPAALPLSHAQERLWFLEQLGLAGPAYNMPLALRLEGDLDLQALERSLAEIVRRHESLRTRFEARDGEAIQVVDGPDGFDLATVDLSRLGSEERAREVERLIQEEVARRFDLAAGSLLRAAVLRLSDLEHVLLVTAHHIVVDAWSQGILVRELSTLYTAFSQGLSSPLPELPLQYADYALWQRGWLQGEVLDRRVDYWKSRLTGASPILELPTDRVRPAVASFKGGISLPSRSRRNSRVACSTWDGVRVRRYTWCCWRGSRCC